MYFASRRLGPDRTVDCVCTIRRKCKSEVFDINIGATEFERDRKNRDGFYVERAVEKAALTSVVKIREIRRIYSALNKKC